MKNKLRNLCYSGYSPYVFINVINAINEKSFPYKVRSFCHIINFISGDKCKIEMRSHGWVIRLFYKQEILSINYKSIMDYINIKDIYDFIKK